MKQKILTGIKATGCPHLGNYVGSIKPSLDLAKQQNISSYLFIADSHALTSQNSSQDLKTSIYQVAASWLACGLDPKKSFFYCQSDIPELFELSWILSCIAAKGLMNRAHSYKMKKDQNQKLGKKDLDDGINMGLYNYPILMAADILLFSPDQVPVGQDQIQHLEMTRDLAQKFCRIYKTKTFILPKALILKKELLLGIDGKKMSKSYHNDIPLFLSSKKREKLIKSIKTDSTPATKPKTTETCTLFQIYKHFANEQEIQSLQEQYSKGLSYGEVKQLLFEKLESYFKEKQGLYDHYMAATQDLDSILKLGAERLREEAYQALKEIKKHQGFINL